MARDPRDVAIDALEAARAALTANVKVINERIEELREDGGSSDSRKHQCGRCGLRFRRIDLLTDHLALVHRDFGAAD